MENFCIRDKGIFLDSLANVDRPFLRRTYQTQTHRIGFVPVLRKSSWILRHHQRLKIPIFLTVNKILKSISAKGLNKCIQSFLQNILEKAF